MIKILYTDDESSLLDIGKVFLEKSGEFLVTTALSAPEAIRLLEQEKFDAIISDYQMPEMDGIQFLVEVRSRFGPIPFILFTGRGREEIVIQAINSGADFYLQKGGEPKAQFAELMHKIKSAASRKRGEDALRRSEEKFRMIVENSHDIIYTLTAEGEFIFVSPAWTTLLGHPVTQVIGQSFMKFIHPDDVPQCMLFLKSVIETGEQQEGVEYRVLHINGVWDWHTTSAVPIKDETGTITGFYGIARDITERKRAEKALKEQLDSLAENKRTLQLNERRLLMAQEIGRTGCWEYNIETNTIWGSAEAHRIFCLSPDAEDFPLDELESCIQEREQVHSALVDLISTGKKYDLEFIINPADGSAQKVIHSIARLEKDAQENPIRVVGVIQDITGRKQDEETLLKNANELHASYAEITASEEELRANLDELSSQEQALRESEEKLAAIVAGSPVPKFVIDRDHKIIYWNRALEQATGFSAGQVIGTREQWRAFYPDERPTMADLILDETFARISELYAGKFSESPVVTGAFEATDFFPHMGDRGTWLRFMAAPIKNLHGVILGAVETLIDVSDIKRAEVELGMKNDELLAANEEITATEEELRANLDELTQQELALQESKKELSDIIEFLPDATFAINTKGAVIAWNHAMEIMTGVKPADILTKGNYEYSLPFYKERRPLLIDLVISYDEHAAEKYPGIRCEGDKLIAEVFIPHMHNGRGAHLWFTSSPLYDSQKKISGAIESIREITEHKERESALNLKNEELSAAYEEITSTEEELRQQVEEIATTQEALRETEQRYRNIVTDQTEFICRFLPDGTHVFVNDAYCRYFGVASEDILGHTFSPTLYPDDRKAVAAFFATLTPQKPVGNIDHRIIMPDGTVRWQRWSDRAIFDDKGNVVDYQSVGRDITEYKEAEERYRNIVDDQTEFICRFLPDGTHVFVNDAYCRYFGVLREDLLNHKFSPTIYPDDRKAVAAFFATLTPEKPVGTIDHRIIMPDGTVRWQRWSDRAIFNDKGNVVEYQSVGRDITEQKVAEEAIKRSESQLTAIIQSSPIPKFVIDKDHHVIHWNKALEGYSGIKEKEIVGTNQHWRAFYLKERPCMADLLLDGSVEKIPQWYAGKYAKSKLIDGAYEATDFFPHMGKTGTWLFFTASVIKDDEGNIIGAIETLEDSTETHLKTEELNIAYQKIQTAFDQVKHSEERYRNIVDDQTEFICRFLRDGTHVFVNDAYCRYFGVARKDILGHRFSPALYPDDRKAVAAFFATLTQEKPVGTIDHRIIMPDGTIHWQRWSDRAIFDDKGNVVEYQSVGRDITEYKEVEAQLQTKSKEYQNLLKNMSDVYYRSDAQGRLILASQSWATLLNYPDLSECMGKNIAGTFYTNPDDRNPFLEKVYQNGYVTDYEITLKKKDGTSVTVATSSYLYFDAAGNVLGVEGTFRDISERKRITEDLKETERKLTDIISFLPDATFVVDKKGTVIAWNHAIEELTGVPAKDMIGKGNYEYALPFYGVRRPILIDLIETADTELEKNYSSVRRMGKILTAETGMAHVGGKNRILWGKASPLYNSRNEVVGAIESIRDFTEQRILEDSLKHVNKKLNLMSSITRHDILNNITVCLGYLELAKYKSPTPDTQKLIDILEQNIGAIQSQIDFTKVYQDLGIAAPVWQDIGGLLRGCPSTGKIPIKSEISNLQIYADPLISKVFYNLYDNAVRHGQHVTEIHVRAEERGRDMVIVWEDDGVGVLQNEKEKIFNRGFGKNTGLGLFLVREILGITGMSILENGETGTGARFEILLPSGSYRRIPAQVPDKADADALQDHPERGAGHGQ